MSCFCPIITLMEPSIIPSTYTFGLQEVRSKISYMKLKASTFSDSTDFLKSIKITGRKKKSGSDGPGRWHLSNQEPWFCFWCSWASCIVGTGQDSSQDFSSGNFTHADLLGSRSRQIVMFNKGFWRTRLHQNTRGLSRFWFKEYLLPKEGIYKINLSIPCIFKDVNVDNLPYATPFSTTLSPESF